jgi:adenine-specific DNA methylase
MPESASPAGPKFSGIPADSENSGEEKRNLHNKNNASGNYNCNSSYPFPATRYQGSKARITEWIWESIKDIESDTVLDAFGGTGCMSHMLKREGKTVTYNDILKFNHIIGKALIENDYVELTASDIEFLLRKDENREYPTFIQDRFRDIFYLDEENAWLDMAITNINLLSDEYKRSLAWFALFQSCIIKRPYNLFHRANLYVRTSDVKRSFGNKTTWDRPFGELFIKFANEANKAVFNNGKRCKSLNCDALLIPEDNHYDLVYIDTPYISAGGVGVDYIDFYHFLEGMTDYENWEKKILNRYKHRPIEGRGENVWSDKKKIYNAFEELIRKYRDSVLVISYRSDGIPSEDEIKNLLNKYKGSVCEVKNTDYRYALSSKKISEVLFIAE